MSNQDVQIDPTVAECKPTALVERIKANFVEQTPEVCSERAQLVTQSYQETEAYPMVIRRAKAFEKILAEMSIFIEEGELIVGNQCSKPRSTPIFPEFSCQWLEDELDRLAKREADVFLISEETKTVLRDQVFPYWKGKTNQEYATSLMMPEALDAQAAGVFTVGNYYFNGVGHISVDYAKVLQCGLEGIIEAAEQEKLGLDLANPEDLKKLQFLEAVMISNRAVIAFAERFAAEAERLAAQADEARKAELLEIARICRQVPAKPAASFHEALQSFWFIQLVIQIESNGHSISPMRMDQYLYPFYAADKEKLGAEKVQELVDLLWIKMAGVNKVRDEGSTAAFGGYPMFQNITDSDAGNGQYGSLCAVSVGANP
jgi:formate C-acetyltransferase